MKTSRRLSFLSFTLSSFLFCLGAFAQSLSTSPTGTVPSNFAINAESSEQLSSLEGFNYRLNTTSTYASNLGLQSSGGDGELALGLGANLSYRTAVDGEALLVGTLSYSPSYQEYFSDQARPGAFSQSLNATLAYNGNALASNIGASYSVGGASNRLAGGFVDSGQLGLNGSLSWNYSPKTSFSINASYSDSAFSDSSLNGSQSSSFGFSASWLATPLVLVGPYINFGQIKSDSAGELDSLGLGMNFSYELTGKTSLTANVGLQTQSFEQGGSGVSFFGEVSATWQPDDIWRVNMGLSTNTIASPTDNNFFINNYDLNLQLTRPLGEGRLSLGSAFSLSQFESAGSLVTTRESDRFLSFTLGYNRPILQQKVSLNTSAGYQKGFGGREFSNFTLSAGLGYSF